VFLEVVRPVVENKRPDNDLTSLVDIGPPAVVGNGRNAMGVKIVGNIVPGRNNDPAFRMTVSVKTLFLKHFQALGGKSSLGTRDKEKDATD